MAQSSVDTKALLNKLTLREKIGQLHQMAPYYLTDEGKGEITGPTEGLGFSLDDTIYVGTALGGFGAQNLIDTQKAYLERSEHKIPLIFMADVIHGCKTIFPIPLAIGCSWDLELAEKTARIAAVECSVSGVQVTFSPMVDLVRDPRWGRVMESTGEDPYLNTLYAKAFVRGYQGDDMSKDGNIGACVKHFAAYGAAEAGRDYNTVDMSERVLREFYMPAYKAALDAGCKLVMTSFNTIDSIPASANEWLLRDVLRKEWGFNGVVISDWGAVAEIIKHGVAEDKKEAARKAMEAGVDIEMMTTCYVRHLEELMDAGIIDVALIDEVVLRILDLKAELGLFENPYKSADLEREKEVLLCNSHREASRGAAAKSSVLLKNDGVLPFKKDISKLALIGPKGDSQDILGAWSWQGNREDAVSLKQGLIHKLGEDKVICAKGCDIIGGSDKDIIAAVEAAKTCDVVVLALGEKADMSGEGSSRGCIKLPGYQEQLAQAIFELGKPTVVVLFNGRPLEITELYGAAPAILEAWFPGTEGGNAIADLLFGDAYPSGRLTMSFPYTVGQIPVYYNALNTGRPKEYEENREHYCSHYLDIPNSPLLPFGYGLTYTSFEYSNIELDSNVLTTSGVIKASVKVKNVGQYKGIETVQLYIRDITACVSRPVSELKGFRRVELNPGEEKEVIFEITEEMLRFYSNKLEYKSEYGKFHVMIGKNAKDVDCKQFVLVP